MDIFLNHSLEFCFENFLSLSNYVIIKTVNQQLTFKIRKFNINNGCIFK